MIRAADDFPDIMCADGILVLLNPSGGYRSAFMSVEEVINT